MVSKNRPICSITPKKPKDVQCNIIRHLIPEVAVSAFAVVPVAVVPVTIDTVVDDDGVNLGTAVGFSEGDTADNIKCCRSRINKDVMVINDVEIKTKRSITEQNFI